MDDQKALRGPYDLKSNPHIIPTRKPFIAYVSRWFTEYKVLDQHGYDTIKVGLNEYREKNCIPHNHSSI